LVLSKRLFSPLVRINSPVRSLSQFSALLLARCPDKKLPRQKNRFGGTHSPRGDLKPRRSMLSLSGAADITGMIVPLRPPSLEDRWPLSLWLKHDPSRILLSLRLLLGHVFRFCGAFC
jgi:hypothetical protein